MRILDMYLSHYNLQEKPFSISPDPKFLWLGEKHQEALAVLKYGILEDKGFLLLTGDIGTGKTALINSLVKIIDVAALVATVPDPGLNSLDFFNFLAEEFGMQRTFDSKGEFLIHFKQFLHDAYKDEKKVLLIIDEAQRLNHDLLEQIRLLSNIETNSRKLINIFFVGQTEFSDTLRQERNKAVRQRIAVNHHLEPLTLSETTRYIRHRLKIAGASAQPFTAEAISEIFTHARGNPRVTNVICDHALLTGYSAGITAIDKKSILECATELQITGDMFSLIGNKSTKTQRAPGADAVRSSQKRKIAASLMLMLLLAVGGYFAYDYQAKETPQWAIEDIAAKKDLKFSEEEKKALVAQLSAGNKENQPVPAIAVAARKTDAVNTAAISGNETGAQENAAALDAGNNDQQGKAGHSAQGLQDQGLQDQVFQDQDLQDPNRKVVLHFKHNSNEIPDQAFESLNRVVRYASVNPETEILVEGYSDSRGNYWYNKKLSKFRADIVKNYFAGQGIPLNRIKTIGRGPENPIAPNETMEGRKQNRRVEIKINLKP
jgi:general secretion pathway protein A